jgi:hypothetical protein
MRGLENSTRSYDVTYKLLGGIFHDLLHTYNAIVTIFPLHPIYYTLVMWMESSAKKRKICS